MFAFGLRKAIYFVMLGNYLEKVFCKLPRINIGKLEVIHISTFMFDTIKSICIVNMNVKR